MAYKLKKGIKVVVLNRTMGGALITEGIATLVSKLDREDEWCRDEKGNKILREQWTVRFEGERQTFPRWVSAQDIIEKEEA